MTFFQRYTSPFLLSLLVLAFFSCDQSFDPHGRSDPVSIVYSILGTDRAPQFVRVFTQNRQTTSISESELNEVPVTDALVTLDDGSNVEVLRDTTLPRPSDSPYTTLIHAYSTSVMRAEFGRRYSLQVRSNLIGSASSVVTIPNHVEMYLAGDNFLYDPLWNKDWEMATVIVYLRPGAKAYILRLILQYELFEDGTWQQKWQEIPVWFETMPFKFEEALYGEMKRLSSLMVREAYSKEAYLIALRQIVNNTFPQRLVFKNVMVQFVQLEENLYNYFSVSNGFQDPLSVRLDDAIYSNISGGVGLFAAYTVDSLVRVLPYDFVYNRR